MATAGALSLAGCGTAEAGGTDSHPHPEAGAGERTKAEGAAVELEHVHGLAVDPADGELYAGTHYGLVRVSAGGQLIRVADRVQDFMGLTVIGPGRYLASGHPGTGQPGPANLGLIESTDAGRTWTTLSLAGDADFHALDAAQGVIYGYTDGRLLVSKDGREWADQGAMAIADLAVDPTQPDRLLVTTEQGPALSADGGRTFDLEPDSPLLQLVAFSPEGAAAFGVSPGGEVYASTDGGRTWDQRGNVGSAPAALGAVGQNVYVAVEGAIVSSTDGGATFADMYRE
ncbi:F510_1955 family glycosylhydrolase [Modestobacter sp. DSM 44400]|uniref:F510_1955 family glycosylhydrolase n=1 Tax=Modestobacter sp. DSM 44400 TaxID=1550230 RepID=UPI001C314339|nr:exo-alpha-sialidase [Modestobacter sp. DSM 44400]